MPTSSKEAIGVKNFQDKKLPKETESYLCHLKSELAKKTIRRHRSSLLKFYRWLEFKERTTATLTPKQLEHQYPRWCSNSLGYMPDTCDLEYYSARSYMIWLVRQGHLPHRKATDFYPYSVKSVQLPSCALEFIEQRKEVSKYAPRRYAQLFNLFHQWLSERNIELSKLNKEQIHSFINFLDKRGYRKKPLHMRKLHMRIYLDWLRDRDLISCDCRELFDTKEQYRNFTLPPYAEEYLSELATHLSPDTIKSYEGAIKGFHRHLHNERIVFAKLKRRNCVQWLEWMFEKEYSASTRLQRSVTVKGYLAWCVDRKLFKWQADDLIQSDDFPKLDDMLPRPLPTEIDIEVQRRLKESTSVYHKGALLLRYTGIRLGDLEKISFNPIHKDQKGRTFLQAPPGKLKRERLIPIEERTVKLIEEIQKQMIPIRKSLGVVQSDDRLFAGRKKKSGFHMVYRSFKKLTRDLEKRPGVGSIYPHRLRHTYATSLLNAGLHPAVLMVLLGHTDLKMTFRYARMSIELVHNAYFMAREQLEKGIRFPTIELAAVVQGSPESALRALQDVAVWLQKEKLSSLSKTKTDVSKLIKRIHRIRSEIQSLGA